MSLADKAYGKALEVLRNNQVPYGFTATTEKVDNYFSVWARDHSITSYAAALTGDPSLTSTAISGLLHLLRNQIDHGQIPSYIEVENRKRVYGGLGSITSVDSNLWVPVTADFLFRRTMDKRFISDANMKRYARLYRLMKAFDSNDCGLIEVPKAGDWADIMNRSYHVLYDEVLFYQALRSLQFLFEQGLERTRDPVIRKKIKKRISWIARRKPRVKKRINQVFWFTEENLPSILEEYMIQAPVEPREYGYYQSHLVPFELYWAKRFDSLGNILAVLTRIANKKRTLQIIRHMKKNGIVKPFPVKAMFPPVYKHERDWEPIYRTREQPHTYHNGGIWPMITGFYFNMLTRQGQEPSLTEFARLVKKKNWGFNEYYHGRTARPMGRRHHAWSAAGYVIAYHSMKTRTKLFY